MDMETATEVDKTIENKEDIKEIITKKLRHRKKQKYNDIRKLMEFYFGDSNLSKDRFLMNLIREDEYVPLSTFLRFNKVKKITNSMDDLITALSNSEILTLSDDKTKIKRTTSIRIKEDVDDYTIYVESLPPSADHDWIQNIFSVYGSVAYVSLPRYKKSGKIKEFAFVEFEQKSSIQKVVTAFKEIGGLLSYEKNPEELKSVVTYLKEQNEEGDNEEIKKEGLADNFVNEEIKKEELAEDCDSEKIKKEEELADVSDNAKIKIEEELVDDSDWDQGPPQKRIKVDHIVKTTESIDCEDKTDVDAILMRNIFDNNEISENVSEIIKKDILTITEEHSNESEVDNPEITEEQKTETKKARLRRKKMAIQKELTISDTISDLKIMTKRDWKKLRNKYLNLQREKIKEVKQQLRQSYRSKKSHSVNVTPKKNLNFYGASSSDKIIIENGDLQTIINTDDKIKSDMKQRHQIALKRTPLYTFESGLIVNVKLQEPCVMINDFKAEMRQYPQVKYVDIKEGDCEAFIRCENSESSTEFTKQIAAPEYNCSILNGQSEIDYWNKINKDREDKITKNIRVKSERTKTKIFKEVSHIHFGDE